MPVLRAVLFDLDGVLTPTAELHMRAWERLFAPYCAAHGLAPYTAADYFASIDGKPRYDGVATFLASRGVTLPRGEVTDAPGSPRCARSATARTRSSTACSPRRASRPTRARSGSSTP